MGRKQKLRRERRNTKNISTAAVIASSSVADAASGTTTGTRTGIHATLAAASGTTVAAANREFPKSNFCVQAEQMIQHGLGEEEEEEGDPIYRLFERGVAEYGCVHSMAKLGEVRVYEEGRTIHLAHPWFLEGALRGSKHCIIGLMNVHNHVKLKPSRPGSPVQGLFAYWAKLHNEYTYDKEREIDIKKFRDRVEKICIICEKQDSESFTLQQCIGCSVYCFCSQDCQTAHWVGWNHRGECKQLQILNKYHMPYAKEIRDAAIRGDIVIPALEKLRYKLGLTRPTEEYQELRDYSTNEGKPIDPSEYLIAREDGTVHLGSLPDPVGLSLSKYDEDDENEDDVEEKEERERIMEEMKQLKIAAEWYRSPGKAVLSDF